MKRFVYLLLIFLLEFSLSTANAEVIKLEAQSLFSSTNPPQTFVGRVVESCYVENFGLISANSIINGEIISVKENKRFKQNASFKMKIIEINDENLQNTLNPTNLYAKYTTQLDNRKMLKEVALTVGNKVVKGVSIGYKTVEGTIKNEENNRLKSAGKAFYDATPLSYIEKGDELIINLNDIVFFNIQVKDTN